MSRGGNIVKRIKEPDSKYKSRVVEKLIALVMEDGKKSIAREIVYGMLEKLSNEDNKEARNYFEDAVRNVMPEVEVRPRRVGGANYQIPLPVRHERAETLALRWIISAAQSQKGKPMVDRLANEIRAAYKNEGEAMKKKINVHKMADANKAFSHFKW